MTLKGKTRIIQIGNSRYFLIPMEVFNDSAFPFSDDNGDYYIEVNDDEVKIRGDLDGSDTAKRNKLYMGNKEYVR